MILFPSADDYGDSEDLLGKLFAANPEKRQDIFLATKFAVRVNPEKGPQSFRVDSIPEYCRQAIGKSRKRLGLPYVDLYYIYHLDKVQPMRKTMEAIIELKNAGKIKHMDLSECNSADSLCPAHKVHP